MKLFFSVKIILSVLLFLIQIHAQELVQRVAFSIEVDGVPKHFDVSFEDDISVTAKRFCTSIDNVDDSCYKTVALHIHSMFADENAKIERHDISVEHAKIMISMDPENRDTKLRLARYLEASGDLNACLQVYKEILSQNPNDKSASLNMATAMHKSGDLDGAITEYLSFLKRFENEEEDQETQIVHNNLGLAYLAIGRTDNALKHMIKASSFENVERGDSKRVRGHAGKQYLMSDLQASVGQMKEAANTFLESLRTESMLMGMNSVAREAMLKSVGVLGNQTTNGVKFSDSAAPPQLVIFCPIKAVYGDGTFFFFEFSHFPPTTTTTKTTTLNRYVGPILSR